MPTVEVSVDQVTEIRRRTHDLMAALNELDDYLEVDGFRETSGVHGRWLQHYLNMAGDALGFVFDQCDDIEEAIHAD